MSFQQRASPPQLDAFPGALATVAATKFCYNDKERTWQFLATATNFSIDFTMGADHQHSILTIDSVKFEALGFKAGRVN